jgi:hypothetical protein
MEELTEVKVRGKIKLLNDLGFPVVEMVYLSRVERNGIIELWSRRMLKENSCMIIQIHPEII